MRFRPRIVDDWRQAWKWISVQLAAVLALWTTLPPDVQVAVVGGIVPTERVPLVLALLIVVGRLLQQGKQP